MGDGNILTDPTRQVGEYLLSGPATVPVAAGPAVKVCGDNPERSMLVVQPTDMALIYLTPMGDASIVPGVIASGSALPLVIHLSVYPVLIAGAWYVLCSAATTVRVWEVSRR